MTNGFHVYAAPSALESGKAMLLADDKQSFLAAEQAATVRQTMVLTAEQAVSERQAVVYGC